MKYYIVLQGQITFNLGLSAAKNTHPIKKALNKSCSEFSYKAHMFISPNSEARGLERLIWLKYYIVLKWPITFNLGPNVAENTHPIKKSLNKSCSELNFVQKSLLAHMSISP